MSNQKTTAATARHDAGTDDQHDPQNPQNLQNPKVSPDGGGASNQIKDPDDWVTGHEPMTGAQASYLKTLSEQAKEPEAFSPDLEKAEASKRIDHLREEIGR